MKKLALLVSALLAFAAAFAEPAPYASASSFTAGPNEAMVILNGLGLYTENGGNLALKETLVIGDRLSLLNRTQKFKVDKTEREYIKVKSPSGTEGWVRSPYALSRVSLAVVKGDSSIVYSQPRDVSITSKTVSKMTIVAVFQDGSTPQFAKVNCYDVAQNIWYTEADNVFVPREDLSFADTDLSAVIMYDTALATKNKAIRTNLFKVIEKKYSNSVFFAEIQAALSPETAAKPTNPATGFYVVNDNNVNVRNSPDEVNGSVVGSLNKGAEVEVVEVTGQSYTIGSLTGPWYHVKSPEGWVFGAFLDAKP